jgi:hypothetical protein
LIGEIPGSWGKRARLAFWHQAELGFANKLCQQPCAILQFIISP